jgi:acetoin utilization deacetylase AcuC-like enzyme
MTTVLFTHPSCLEHDTGAFHPECPDRLRAIQHALASPDFAGLRREAAPSATLDHLRRVHTGRHIDGIRDRAPVDERLLYLDPDTVLSKGSWNAALHAAGAVVAAVDAVARRDSRNAFCAMRPPGHHATPDHAMGFCLFNNVAVGALHARARYGLQRVAVVDFDVHHGNGTQDMFESDPDLFYASTHQSGAYPGTGRAEETGVGQNIVNVPLPGGSSSTMWRRAVSGIVLPKLRAFKPDMILISAGFDAHEADPLAQMRLVTEDFRWVTREICQVAALACEHRVVSTLEGGYDLTALAHATAAHVRALMEA